MKCRIKIIEAVHAIGSEKNRCSRYSYTPKVFICKKVSFSHNVERQLV